MLAEITQWILESLRVHGGWAVFAGVVLEQVIVPLPSPVIIMGAGLLLIPASASWGTALWIATWQITVPAVIASSLGAVGMYFLGVYGGKVVIHRFHRFLGFDWQDIESLGRHFDRRGVAVSLFSLRAAPIVPLSLISVFAGVTRIPFRPFLFWSVLGTIPRCYLLGVVGWAMGAEATLLAKGVNRLESVASLLVILMVVGGVVWIRGRVRRSLLKKTQNPSSINRVGRPGAE